MSVVHAAMIAALLVAGAASAQPPTGQSVQQQFQAATALSRQQKHHEALAAWQALAQRVTDNPRNLALVRVRMAQELLDLGRRDEAAKLAEEGLAALPAGDTSLNGDRYSTHLLLGQIGFQSLDYATALDHYVKAEALADTPATKIPALLGEVSTGTFVAPDKAQAAADQLMTMLPSVRLDDKARGLVLTTVSELYLNLKQYDRATKIAHDAVTALGGMGIKVDLYDVSARSDVAIAEIKLKNFREAKRYLAMTGAGKSTGAPFLHPELMFPPDCGGEAGLKPDDDAIVEFSVGDDGGVVSSRPVWASRPEVATAFARAVRSWAWRPEQLHDVAPFFRNRVRVEMRCSTELPQPWASNPVKDAFDSWLKQHGVTIPDAHAVPEPYKRIDVYRQRLAALDAAAKGNGPQALGLLVGLADQGLLPDEDRLKSARRAMTIAEASNLPPLALLHVKTALWAAQQSDKPDSNVYLDHLRAAWNDTGLPKRAHLAVGMSLANRLSADKANPILETVANAALPKDDPLRIDALVQLASNASDRGEEQQATRYFEQSGVSGGQCSSLYSTPRVKGVPTSSEDYPDAARNWGFDGWVMTQFNIAADGETRDHRVVLAYPAFVFDKAALSIIHRARYAATHQPNGEMICGTTQTITFMLGN